MEQDKLIIGGYQYPIVWENSDENLKKIKALLQKSTDLPDIFVLPETFSSGFTNNTAAVAQSMDGEVLVQLKELAALYKMAVCGSLVIAEEGRFFNRFVFIHPDGHCEYYDKRHLFTMSNENDYYSKGNRRVIVNFKGWRILLQVCYDLRFPVWSRNRDDYDLIFYVANWPASRHNVWATLLKARAIENQCYVFGLNRNGTDAKGIAYKGYSVFVDPRGGHLNKPSGKTGIIKSEIKLSELELFRRKFPVLNDKDSFEII